MTKNTTFTTKTDLIENRFGRNPEDADFCRDIVSIVRQVSEDFNPPLSVRAKDKNPLTCLEPDPNCTLYCELMLANSLIVAYDEDGTPIAFTSFYDTDEHTYLDFIATLPACRGRGVGRALYREVMEHAPTGVVKLRTWSENDAQRGLLSSLGFHIVEVREKDRPNGDDTLYYEWHRDEIDEESSE